VRSRDAGGSWSYLVVGFVVVIVVVFVVGFGFVLVFGFVVVFGFFVVLGCGSRFVRRRGRFRPRTRSCFYRPGCGRLCKLFNYS
jgi:hypothetical protein